MRIAVTGLRGIPGVMGGVETHCEELLPRVKRLAPDAAITVFARSPYVPAGERDHAGVHVVPISSPRSQSLEAIVATFNSILAARRAGAEMIHIHAIGPALLAPLARILGMRVIVTHHGEDYRRAKWGFVARQMLRLGEQMALRWSHRLIAVSPSLAARLREASPAAAERILFIPNGVPAMPAPKGDALSRFGLKPRDYVLAVGRLVPEKGLHDLIDAHAHGGDARTLVIVGGADHESAYATKLRGMESETVRFTGPQDRATVRELFEQASLFVMPSYHEGLPIAALEAASCATPMLLSDIQPNLDLGLAAHHYFPVGDVAALAERLARPASDYAVEREAFLRAFDWDRISERTLEVYRAIAA